MPPDATASVVSLLPAPGVDGGRHVRPLSRLLGLLMAIGGEVRPDAPSPCCALALLRFAQLRCSRLVMRLCRTNAEVVPLGETAWRLG